MFEIKPKEKTFADSQVAEMVEAQRSLTYGMTILEQVTWGPGRDTELKKHAGVARVLLDKTIPRYLKVVPEHIRSAYCGDEQIENLKGLCRKALR